jgi:hypothetical protein
MSLDRLFVPLAEQPFRWFESGLKTWELRKLARSFTEKHVRIGRPVELRRGYNTPDSRWGIITDVKLAPSIAAFFDLVPFEHVICDPAVTSKSTAIAQAAAILGICPETVPVIGFNVPSTTATA